MTIPDMIADDSIFLVSLLRTQGYTPARALAALCGAVVAVGFLQQRPDLADMEVGKVAAIAMDALLMGEQRKAAHEN